MSDAIPSDAYLLIIGAMKSGTTSLYSYLEGHPQLCGCKFKEPEYFSEHQRHGGPQVDEYEKLWDFDATIHRFAMEASTGYTKYPLENSVPQKIFDYGLNPKFVYILRNPLDRIESHYNSLRRAEWFNSSITDSYLISISNYYLQLQQYQPFFPRDSFLLLSFDDLKDDPALVLQRVYEFLDLSPHYLPQSYEAHNRTVVTTERARRINFPGLDTLARVTPAPLRSAGRKLLIKEASQKRVLTKAERDLIYRELEDDMANLYHEYGFDVRKWGFGF